MELRKVFGQNLRRLRQERGFSQEELAHEADVDRTYISALERGVYNASVSMIEKLAKALGVEPKSLLERRSPHGHKKP